MKTKREAAYAMWAEGMSYSAIGKTLKLSRQRAQQLVRPPKHVWEIVRTRAKDKCEECGIGLSLGEGHVHHGQIGNGSDPRHMRYLCRSCHRLEHLSGLGAKGRNKVVRARITTEEYKRLEQEAQKQMRTLSQWVRLKLGVQP